MQGLGKTTMMDVLSRLVRRPWRAASATEAALYSDTDDDNITMLIDEMHYADLTGRRAQILHAAYRQGTPTRLAKRSINLFCAAAFGFIGSCLTNELQSRSLFVQMRKHDGSYPLRPFHFADTADLDAVYQQLCDWGVNVQLDGHPELPPELLRDSRWADNARPLLAIADTAGKIWGEAARKALVNLIVLHQSEHPNAILINHLHQVFADRGYPAGMWSAEIVAVLNANEDWPWREYRGLAGTYQPRPLRQTDLAIMLHQFDARIRPRSVRIGTRTAKGYKLEELEPQFRSYCADYRPHRMEAAQ
jgi:putative DNA primase/helicase